MWFNQENIDYKIYSNRLSLEGTLLTAYNNSTVCIDMHFSKDDTLYSPLLLENNLLL